MKKLFAILAVISIFTIISCSGGGGGDSTQPVPLSPVIEPVPPADKPFVWNQSNWNEADWQ